MAIGTALAIGLGAAALGKGAEAVSANGAAKKAARTAQNTADQNNALQQQIYGQNKQALSPFMQTGQAAGNQLNAMLGLGGGTDFAAFTNADPWRVSDWQTNYKDMSAADYGRFNYNYDLNRGRQEDPNYQGFDLSQYDSAKTAQNGFANYLANSDYAYQSALGGRNVASQYYGGGVGQSGAAMKALQDRQNNINTGYRTEYMNALANQQGVGLSGASALAGVGQNYAANVSANNNSAGSAVANAALARGNNNPFANMLGVVGGGLIGGY